MCGSLSPRAGRLVPIGARGVVPVLPVAVVRVTGGGPRCGTGRCRHPGCVRPVGRGAAGGGHRVGRVGVCRAGGFGRGVAVGADNGAERGAVVVGEPGSRCPPGEGPLVGRNLAGGLAAFGAHERHPGTGGPGRGTGARLGGGHDVGPSVVGGTGRAGNGRVPDTVPCGHLPVGAFAPSVVSVGAAVAGAAKVAGASLISSASPEMTSLARALPTAPDERPSSRPITVGVNSCPGCAARKSRTRLRSSF